MPGLYGEYGVWTARTGKRDEVNLPRLDGYRLRRSRSGCGIGNTSFPHNFWCMCAPMYTADLSSHVTYLMMLCRRLTMEDGTQSADIHNLSDVEQSILNTL